jgi:SAM-dependent methyltransferase
MSAAELLSTAREYEAFAAYYDDFTAASNYEKWTGFVLELAGRLGLRGTTLLDVACGTGKSFVPFLRRGFDVMGCDVSAGMLAEAARKAPEVRLVQADMRELPSLGSFDLVTCFDDSLNYLLEERDLRLAFQGIGRNMSETGVLLFDLNTLLAYRTTFARDDVTSRDGTFFAWQGEAAGDVPPGARADAVIDIFAPGDAGLYRRIRVRHAQRHFPAERVTALLAGAGLDCLGVYGVQDDGSLDPEPDEGLHLKVLYAARRAKGGEAK